ncbi:MAG: intracellular multiplication and macrophage-killing family protein [Proteobacteria bacterium]|nr:intracellular multiplication and macrophage-killing family protein [Pseudomonadota bacterium]
MLRSTFRILVAILLAAIVWWIGPLVAIGRFYPFGWLWLRQVLVVLLLLWGFFPLLSRFFSWFFSLIRLRRRPNTVASHDRISSRLGDLDLTLRKIWLERQKGFLHRLIYRARKGYLKEQPWFLVLGAAGAGKTSLLNHTGQNALSGDDNGLPRLGASTGQTEDCGFWVNDRAVWIDSTGQWAEPGALGESSFVAWKRLLTGIRRMRRGEGINGLVICIDIAWLLEAGSEQRKRLADTLRGRVLELADWFSTDLPLYMVLTHLDKLPGGAAMLAALEDDVLADGLGFEVLPDGDIEAWYRQFESRAQRLIQYLVPQIADTYEARQLLDFAESLAASRPVLIDLVKSIVLHSPSTYGSQLRGVWLGTSVYLMLKDNEGSLLQLDEPNDSPSLRSFARTLRAPIDQAISERNILRHQDKSLASRGKRILRWGLSVAMLLVVGLWLAVTYFDQRNYVDQLWAEFTEGKRLAQDQIGMPKSDLALIDVAAQMRYAGANLGDGIRLLPTAYFEHIRIDKVAYETYRRHLFKTFTPELFKYVTSQLKSEIDGGTGDVYQTLKVYLMLCRPERRDPLAAMRWFESRWEKIAPANSSEQEKQAFLSHVKAAFNTPHLPATPEDAALVIKARAAASGLPSAIRAIDHVKSQGLPESMYPVSLSSAGGLNAPLLLRMRSDVPSTDPVINGWYTRAGYHDAFMPRILGSARAVLDEEGWILRDETKNNGNAFETEKAVQDLSDAARRQFLQDYIAHWNRFISDITVRRYSSMDDAASIAKALTDPQSPLSQLLRFIGRETSLTGNYEGDVDSWIDRQKLRFETTRRAVVGELSGQHFRYRVLPEHVVDDYFNTLRRLAVSLNPSSGGEMTNNPLVRLFEPLYRQLSLVNGAMQAGQLMPEYDAFRRMRADAARQPEPVRGIMLDLIDSGSQSTAKKSSADISRGAAGVSKSVCPQVVARYPSLRSTSRDAGTEDFRRLFGPRGVLDAYFKDQLEQYVDTSAIPWRARQVEGMSGNLVSGNILRSYEQARIVRDTFFDPSGQIAFSVIVRPVDMDASIAEAVIDIGGEQLRYAHGAVVPKKVDWSTQRSSMIVRLHMRSVDGRTQQLEFSGPWAIFRFYDAGEPVSLADDKRVVVYRTALGSLSLEFQATSNDFPLWSRALSQFRCP